MKNNNNKKLKKSFWGRLASLVGMGSILKNIPITYSQISNIFDGLSNEHFSKTVGFKIKEFMIQDSAGSKRYCRLDMIHHLWQAYEHSPIFKAPLFCDDRDLAKFLQGKIDVLSFSPRIEPKALEKMNLILNLYTVTRAFALGQLKVK